VYPAVIVIVMGGDTNVIGGLVVLVTGG